MTAPLPARWEAQEPGACHTRRREVKQGCRDGWKDVDPAWLKRNGKGVSYQWRYWDGETSSYPGEWAWGYEPTLRAAKKKATALVSSGVARHDCEISMVCWTWGCTGQDYALRQVWIYGRYVRAEK